MHKIINATKTVLLAIVISFGLSYVYAWTAPTVTPPGGNVSAPINTSATLQQKSGDFTVANFVANTMTVGATINANAITAPQFCLGASCITAWTQAGQPKVTGSCAVGQAITAINADGTVTCGSAGRGSTVVSNTTASPFSTNLAAYCHTSNAEAFWTNYTTANGDSSGSGGASWVYTYVYSTWAWRYVTGGSTSCDAGGCMSFVPYAMCDTDVVLLGF